MYNILYFDCEQNLLSCLKLTYPNKDDIQANMPENTFYQFIISFAVEEQK